jgi:hypothetical protein
MKQLDGQGTRKNWTQRAGKWSWVPPVASKQEVVATLPERKSLPVGSAEGGLENLRMTAPSLTRWRKYWTEQGALDCSGWHLRSVEGFTEDNE